MASDIYQALRAGTGSAREEVGRGNYAPSKEEVEAWRKRQSQSKAGMACLFVIIQLTFM